MQKNILVNKNNISFTVEDSEELHQDVGYNFWSEKYSSWEPGTFKVLDSYLSKDKDYLDIGAWVGPTAIYGSFLSKKVVAVEPDPIAHKILQKNISLNSISNIDVINKAASKLESAFLESSNFFGDSMTRVSERNAGSNAIETIGLDTLISMGDFSLIKIDIEGHEFSLIKEYIDVLNECKIPLLLSIHALFFGNGETLMKDLLNDMSSVKSVLNEDGEEINKETISNSFGSYLFIW
jgi:FkbM family methyltransferase